MNSTMIVGRIEVKEKGVVKNSVPWKILLGVTDEFSGKTICHLWCRGDDSLARFNVGDHVAAQGQLRNDLLKQQPSLQIRSIHRIPG